jgi:hypothetical protein
MGNEFVLNNISNPNRKPLPFKNQNPTHRLYPKLSRHRQKMQKLKCNGAKVEIFGRRGSSQRLPKIHFIINKKNNYKNLSLLLFW